ADGRGPPRGRAGREESVAAYQGVATARGGLASTEGLFPGSRAVAAGRSFTLGPSDGGASARAGRPGPWPGGAAVPGGAVPGLVGTQRWRAAPAGLVLVHQRPLAPGARRPSGLDEEKGWRLRWHGTEERIDVTLTRPPSSCGRAPQPRALGQPTPRP